MAVDIQTIWAGLAAGAIAIAATALWRGRAQAREAATRAVLDEAPEGVFRRDVSGWRANDAGRRLLGIDPGSAPTTTGPMTTATLSDHLSENDRATVAAAVAALEARGHAFDINVRRASDGRALMLQGRSAAGVATVWVRDDGTAAWLAERLERETAETTRLKGLMDALPMPVWWRRAPDLRIDGHNDAYAKLFGSAVPGGSVSEPGIVQTTGSHDLAKLALRTGGPQSESRHLVTRDGERRAFDVVEAPIFAQHGVVVGYGMDMTALESLQSSLAEHIAVQDEVLERLTSAIAVFGPDRRLKFFNSAYAQMWRLDRSMLNDQPTIGTLMQGLRERGILPEQADFQAYRQQVESYFTTLVTARQELMHLPDGRTLRMVALPHPLGGLIFQFEDVTDRLALESSHQMLSAVQASTLNSLFEGVGVFGRDGRLKLFNEVYARMFGLDADWLRTEPHVADVVDRARPFLVAEDDDWEAARMRLIAGVAEPKARQGRMALTDGRVLQYAFVPLPDSQCLVLYFDVTDSMQVEEALRERNRALENADLLKSQFISSVSYELRTPLNAILGFGELLRLGLFDRLTPRQEVYVDDILSAAGMLADLIGDILDLAAVQAGFMEFERAPLDLGDALRTAADAARRNAVADVTLTLNCPAENVPTVGDRRRLSQAFRNLMIDALNAAVSGSTVTVTVTLAEGGEADVGPTVTIDVPQVQMKEIGWAEAIVAGDRSATEAERTLATSADIGISLARSLLRAQAATLSPGPAPRGQLRVVLPAAQK